jgi:DnaK suppressor protein
MTEEERKDLKKKILCLIDGLRDGIKSLEEASRPVAPDNAIGRLTRMEAISARGISEASLNSARARLTRLQNAINRIDTPDFGLCSICEEPIPLKRLMLIPETTRCVRCVED